MSVEKTNLSKDNTCNFTYCGFRNRHISFLIDNFALILITTNIQYSITGLNKTTITRHKELSRILSLACKYSENNRISNITNIFDMLMHGLFY